MFNSLTIGFFILGSIGVFVSIPGLIRSFRSRKWPSVKGEVIESSISISRSNDVSDRSVYPHLVFEYTVNDIKYKSSKIAIIRGCTESEAKIYPGKYPVGSDIYVYYNPLKPATAVIEPGFHMTAFLGLYISAIFMFMGAYWMFA